MIKNLITESFSLNLHTNVSFVPNAAERALDPIIKNGIQNVTIVIDHGVIENDRMEIFLKEIRDNLKVKKMISYHGGEPTYTKLEEIRDEINDKKTGAIFAIGGGSTIDVGKALAVLLTNPGPAISYRGFDKSTEPSLPIITVPTLSGTGSEITPNASFVDVTEMRKLGINGECVRPTFSIIDPSFSLSCPKRAILSSAVDSLVHSTEAFVAKKSNPASRLFAKEAFKLTCSSIQNALSNNEDLAPRCSLALASLYAALAMMNSGTGPAAAMSYPMGVRYNVSHGLAGAMFLPFVAEITENEGCMIHNELITDVATKGSTYFNFVSDLWSQLGLLQNRERQALFAVEEDIFIKDCLELSAALDQHPVPFGAKEIKTVLNRIKKTNRIEH